MNENEMEKYIVKFESKMVGTKGFPMFREVEAESATQAAEIAKKDLGSDYKLSGVFLRV